MTPNDFQLGQNTAMVKALSDEIAALRKDVASILDTLAEQRGHRRGTLGLAAGVAAVVAFLGNVLGLWAKARA